MSYRKTAATETLVGIGMDATQLTLASGASITGLNTSTAIKDGSQAIRDLTRMRLNTAIVSSGIKAAQSITKEVAQ
jgi:tetrahydromethanopterin S-methyltransferase subunit D